ncbi:MULTISPECIES: cytochrome o ubiquinol oxidase subunit IV [Cupriavidus]
MKTKHLHPAGAADAADAAHGSLKGYVAGFVLSVLLTFASFGAVMLDVVPRHLGLAAIVALCVVQLLVQLVFFMHMGTARDQRQNTGIFVCSVLLIAIIVAGSLWVMHNANVNMMPTQMSMERAKMRD